MIYPLTRDDITEINNTVAVNNVKKDVAINTISKTIKTQFFRVFSNKNICSKLASGIKKAYRAVFQKKLNIQKEFTSIIP